MLSTAKRFWSLIITLSTIAIFNALVSYAAIVSNQTRIANLELENQENKYYNQAILINVEKSSRETSERVVAALTGLTKVFNERSINDDKQLELLEAIYHNLTGEKHGE